MHLKPFVGIMYFRACPLKQERTVKHAWRQQHQAQNHVLSRFKVTSEALQKPDTDLMTAVRLFEIMACITLRPICPFLKGL